MVEYPQAPPLGDSPADGRTTVKLIIAIVNTDHLDELRDRLFEIGAPGLTVDGIMGIGKPLSQMRYSEAKGFIPKFFARSRVEIVVED